MNLNPIGIAVPLFFLFISIEWLICIWKDKKYYRLNDVVGDLGCGSGDQILGIFWKVVTVGIYAWVYTNFALIELPQNNIWVWIGAFVAIDFFYYLFHRFSHVIHIGWATHQVHHQSEDFNLAVALRQSWFAKVFAWVFYIPVALAGVGPVIYATCYAFNLLYQFWIHTRLIGKMGPFEWIMNTPSHHRVHHGTNPKYLDKNFAGVFIIWDRLLGTFVEEDEEPVYGVLAPLRSWNPWTVNCFPVVQLFRKSLSMQGIDKLLIWFAPTNWKTKPQNKASVFPVAGSGYDQDNGKAHPYILLHLISLGFFMTWLLLFTKQIPMNVKLPTSFLLILTVCCWAGMLEARPWVRWTENLRLLAMGAMGFYALTLSSWPLAISLISFSIISLIWFASIPILPSFPAQAKSDSS